MLLLGHRLPYESKMACSPAEVPVLEISRTRTGDTLVVRGFRPGSVLVYEVALPPEACEALAEFHSGVLKAGTPLQQTRVVSAPMVWGRASHGAGIVARPGGAHVGGRLEPRALSL